MNEQKDNLNPNLEPHTSGFFQEQSLPTPHHRGGKSNPVALNRRQKNYFCESARSLKTLFPVGDEVTSLKPLLGSKQIKWTEILRIRPSLNLCAISE